jgi:hypothetical protein
MNAVMDFQEELDGLGMWHVWGERCAQGFGGEA